MSDAERKVGPSWVRAARHWWAAGLIVAVVGVGLALAQSRRATLADPNASLKPAPIDAKRAFSYLEKIFKEGPHVAGSEANARLRRSVAEHFKALGATVTEQPFRAADPLTGRPVEMVNLIASWNPERMERVVIASHYDSRPYPDQDMDLGAVRKPFVGANDPASGIAMLMEIAHHLKKMDTPWGVDLVLFDGEELVYGGGPQHQGEYFLGSRYFARDYAAKQKRRAAGSAVPKYTAGILLDLFAGKDAVLNKEPHSMELAPRLVRDVWGVAKSLGIKQFQDREARTPVLDDHLPMNDGGIPTIDIIDFDYPHWHRSTDVPENCSPESMEAVGKVVTAWLTKPKPKR